MLYSLLPVFICERKCVKTYFNLFPELGKVMKFQYLEHGLISIFSVVRLWLSDDLQYPATTQPRHCVRCPGYHLTIFESCGGGFSPQTVYVVALLPEISQIIRPTLYCTCAKSTSLQIIVHELRRINLLRAELWAGVLGHRYTDITRLGA